VNFAPSTKQSRRQARVRAHWTPPPGPRPAGASNDPALRPRAGETLDALSGDWRIFQRRDGHRYSTDDLLTAWYGVHSAARLGVGVHTALDLGAGIGSVAMMVAWRLPLARVVGIEAQEMSATLFARSVRYNGASDRITVCHGDLRDPSLLRPLEGRCDLVTGSPPYLPHGRGTASLRPQCDPCRFERRGGVEDYARAAALALSSDGVFALVHEHAAHDRVRAAGEAAGLHLHRRRPILFRDGRAPLIALYALTRTSRNGAYLDEPPLVIRTRGGERGEEYRAVRGDMGFPP
jgi:tRNA1(Val) A37 N6-methylase TrmN6